MNSTNNSNGRVNIKEPKTGDLFALYDKIPVTQCTTFRSPTAGLWDETQLSDTFFSKKNIIIIQNGIRAGVYQLSHGKYTIGPQDCDVLKIIMRSTFLQHAANQGQNIQGQVNELNKIVLDYCVSQVYGEVQGYLKYIDDVTTLAQPISYPVMSSTNDKQLELKPWF